MERKHRIPSPFYIVAAVAIVALIASFGASLPWLPFAEVALDHPTAASSDGSFTAVATELARKVLIIDPQGNLYASINYETFEAPIEVATDVCVSNGRVYVAGVRHKPDSDAIALERVVAYSMTGAQQGVVYEREGQGTTPRIHALDDGKGGVQVCVTSEHEGDEDRTSLEFLLVGDGEPRELASAELGHDMLQTASYAPKTGKIATLSERGIIDDEGSAGKADVPLGWATGAMFVVRSAARIAKPFILSGLLLVSGRMAVIIIGAFCLVCATTFFLVTRKEW